MTQQNDGLTGKLVARDFWPKCMNCVHYAECRNRVPRHGACPHIWHWGTENAVFSDGVLILVSWVGSSSIGEEHTGCTHYRVDEAHLRELKEDHRLYLELAGRLYNIETQMDNLESWGGWDQELYAEWEAIFGMLNSLTGGE